MEFQKERCFTALNADELKVGSKVYLADNLASLRYIVKRDCQPKTLDYICSEDNQYRFMCDVVKYALAYLVEEPEGPEGPEGLKWTDLKVGDVIQLSSVDRVTFIDRVIECMVTEIDRQDTEACHIRAGVTWLTDEQLKLWKKVEND